MTPETPGKSVSGESGDEVPENESLRSADDAQEIIRKNAGGRDRLRPVTKVTTEPADKGAFPPLEEPGEGHFRLLASLVSRTLFFDYFVHVAEARYTGRSTASKVRQLIEDSRRFYKVVVVADLALRGISIVILLGAIVAVLVKTVIL